jgi:prepilin-type N-terminal cleavage/methylation domain-containing protein
MKRGFSLIEVLLVVVILGLTAGVAVPALEAVLPTGTRLESPDDVRELMATVRTSAANRGERYTLRIDTQTGHFVVALTGEAGPETVTEGTLGPHVHFLIDGQARWLSWGFSPTGLAYGDSVLVQGTSETGLVGIDRWTGRPYVRPW